MIYVDPTRAHTNKKRWNTPVVCSRDRRLYVALFSSKLTRQNDLFETTWKRIHCRRTKRFCLRLRKVEALDEPTPAEKVAGTYSSFSFFLTYLRSPCLTDNRKFLRNGTKKHDVTATLLKGRAPLNNVVSTSFCCQRFLRLLWFCKTSFVCLFVGAGAETTSA